MLLKILVRKNYNERHTISQQAEKSKGELDLHTRVRTRHCRAQEMA
jgi:hypothetical protein